MFIICFSEMMFGREEDLCVRDCNGNVKTYNSINAVRAAIDEIIDSAIELALEWDEPEDKYIPASGYWIERVEKCVR